MQSDIMKQTNVPKLPIKCPTENKVQFYNEEYGGTSTLL